jgi:hypothetical protein
MSETKQQGSGKARKVFKYMGMTMLVVLGALFVGDMAWEGSGSNEWQVASDKDGIRVSTLKTPGYRLLKYKVNMQVDARLSDVVFYLSDTGTGSDVGAKDVKRLESVTSQAVSYVYDTYKLDLPPPFGQAEVVLINTQKQDPLSKKVFVNIFAASNKKPLDPTVNRVGHLSNSWTLTPRPGGGVEIESISEFDVGLPYALANAAVPGVVAEEFGKMRNLLKQDKYKNHSLSFISELDQAPPQAALTGQAALPGAAH